jgi:hypothetical protein
MQFLDVVWIIIDSVVCPFYQFIECVTHIDGSPCDWNCLSKAFDCVANLFGLLTPFSDSSSYNLDIFGGLINMVNEMWNALESSASSTSSIWDEIFGSLRRKKSFTPGSEFEEMSTGGVFHVLQQMDELSKASKRNTMHHFAYDHCTSNIIYNSKEDYFETRKPNGCSPIDAIKRVVICFLDGGNCIMDPMYDSSVFREYDPKFTRKTLSIYADYIWEKTLKFMNVTDNPFCYTILNGRHPLKMVGHSNLPYATCLKLMMPLNEFKIAAWVTKMMGSSFETEKGDQIVLRDDTPLVIKAQQTSAMWLERISNLSRNSREESKRLRMRQRENGQAQEDSALVWVAKQVYDKYSNSKYPQMLSSYARQSKLLKKAYYSKTVSIADGNDATEVMEILGQSSNTTSEEEYMKLQAKLFINHLDKFREEYHKSKPRWKRGCHKWNNYGRCKYESKWEREAIESGSIPEMVMVSDAGAVTYYEGNWTEEVIEYNEMRNREYIESDVDGQLMWVVNGLRNFSQRHNLTRAFRGVFELTGLSNWNIVKVPHGLYTAISEKNTKEVKLWLQGDLKYSIHDGFEEVSLEEKEEPKSRYTAVTNSIEPAEPLTWEKFKSVYSHHTQRLRAFRQYASDEHISIDEERKYFLFPIFNIRKDNPSTGEEYNITLNGVHLNQVFDFLMQVNNTRAYPNETYEIAFILPNGTRVVKQFTSSNFNFNEELLEFVDSVIHVFGAPANFLKDQYNDFIRIVGKPDYVNFFKDVVIPGIEFFFTCHVKQNINGTYLYNIFCFPLLPINIFSWITYVPNQYVPLQIPWPEELIVDNCVNVYNGRHGLLTYRRSDNCGMPGNRPFCPQIDYCQRTYRPCSAVGFSPDALDPILFANAVLPQLINWFFFGGIDIGTAEFISIFLSLFLFPIAGPVVGIIILGLIIFYWGVQVFLIHRGIAGVPFSFIVAIFLFLIAVYVPSLVNFAGFMYTVATLFIVFWLYCVIFGFNGFTINITQILIDITKFVNETAPLSWLVPDLQFLIDRFERFNYNYGHVPSVDIMCFLINYGNFAAGIGLILLAAYIFTLIGQSIWEGGKAGASATSGLKDSASGARSGVSSENLASHGEVFATGGIRGKTVNAVNRFTSDVNNSVRETIGVPIQGVSSRKRKTQKVVIPEDYIDEHNTNMKIRNIPDHEKKKAMEMIGYYIDSRNTDVKDLPIKHGQVVMAKAKPKPKGNKEH